MCSGFFSLFFLSSLRAVSYSQTIELRRRERRFILPRCIVCGTFLCLCIKSLENKTAVHAFFFYLVVVTTTYVWHFDEQQLVV